VSDQAHDHGEQVCGAPLDGVDSADQRIEFAAADATGRPASARVLATLLSCHATNPPERARRPTTIASSSRSGRDEIAAHSK
jgi:hypothetical protein